MGSPGSNQTSNKEPGAIRSSFNFVRTKFKGQGVPRKSNCSAAVLELGVPDEPGTWAAFAAFVLGITLLETLQYPPYPLDLRVTPLTFPGVLFLPA